MLQSVFIQAAVCRSPVSKNLKYLAVFIGIEIFLLIAFIFRDAIWSANRIPAIMSRNERLIRLIVGDWAFERYIEISILLSMAVFLLAIVGTIRKIRKAQLQ